MFCLNRDCVLIISFYLSGKILRLVRLSLIVIYREYRYIEDRYIGVLSLTFYCDFCKDIE